MLTPEKRELITKCLEAALAVVQEARTTKAWWIGVSVQATPPGYRFTLAGPFKRGAAVHRRGTDPNTLTAHRILEHLSLMKHGPFTRKDLDLYEAEVAAGHVPFEEEHES